MLIGYFSSVILIAPILSHPVDVFFSLPHLIALLSRWSIVLLFHYLYSVVPFIYIPEFYYLYSIVPLFHYPYSVVPYPYSTVLLSIFYSTIVPYPYFIVPSIRFGIAPQIRAGVLNCTEHPHECDGSGGKKAPHLRVYPHRKGVDGDNRSVPSVYSASEVSHIFHTRG